MSLPRLSSIRSSVKRVLLEASLHRSRRDLPNRRPAVCVFPSNQPWDPASNLRAWLVAPELERLGWRVLVVPEPLSLSQRRRFLALERPDVVLMQQTRHLLNQPSLYPQYPCILDADDADYLDPAHTVRIQKAARDASAVVGGSRFVASCLGAHNPTAYVLWTSTPLNGGNVLSDPRDRGPVVTWAHASPLAYHHEASFVREVMTGVFRRSRGEFWLFGTDGESASEWLKPLREAGGVCRAIPSLEYADYLARVAECAIGLQPVAPQSEFSQGKSFGKLLAYLSGQVAVVASNAVDHPLFFRDGVNGRLVGHDPSSWTEAIVALLDDPEARSQMAMNGFEGYRSRLTTERYASLLDAILRKAAGLPLEKDHVLRLAQCAWPRQHGALAPLNPPLFRP